MGHILSTTALRYTIFPFYYFSDFQIGLHSWHFGSALRDTTGFLSPLSQPISGLSLFLPFLFLKNSAYHIRLSKLGIYARVGEQRWPVVYVKNPTGWEGHLPYSLWAKEGHPAEMLDPKRGEEGIWKGAGGFQSLSQLRLLQQTTTDQVA